MDEQYLSIDVNKKNNNMGKDTGRAATIPNYLYILKIKMRVELRLNWALWRKAYGDKG